MGAVLVVKFSLRTRVSSATSRGEGGLQAERESHCLTDTQASHRANAAGEECRCGDTNATFARSDEGGGVRARAFPVASALLTGCFPLQRTQTAHVPGVARGAPHGSGSTQGRAVGAMQATDS